MPKGRPGERRHFKNRNIEQARKNKQLRENIQRLRAGYEREVQKLKKEIKTAQETLRALDIARHQGKTTNQTLRENAVMQLNTASARLGMINQRLRDML